MDNSKLKIIINIYIKSRILKSNPNTISQIKYQTTKKEQIRHTHIFRSNLIKEIQTSNKTK